MNDLPLGFPEKCTNGSSGVQGTGTTIELITPGGQASTFFTSSLVGLDTALWVLKAGFVIVGNAADVGGTTVGQGALQILDANGKVVETLTDSALIDGPWDLAMSDQGNYAQVFVANVLTGRSTPRTPRSVRRRSERRPAARDRERV